MNAKLSLRRLYAVALSLVVVLTLWQFTSGVHAQKAAKPKTAHPPAAGDKKAAINSEAAVNNAENGAKVK